MIKLTALEVTEFRGIKKLSLPLGGESFAICGRNGTGKSGVVDAIQFALTGKISRLAGSGTNGLSTKVHGPHVDARGEPDSSMVKLEFSIPSAGVVSATISRTVGKPKEPTIAPDTAEVRAALASVMSHPEFTLSRRELIRYVLSEAGKRSADVQSLLQLERVGEFRALFQKISNAEVKDAKYAADAATVSGARLRTVLAINDADAETATTAVNARRAELGLTPVSEVFAPGAAISGLNDEGRDQVALPKSQWLVSITSATDAVDVLIGDELASRLENASNQLSQFLGAADKVRAGEHQSLLEQALGLFDGNECPVCHLEWEAESFQEVVNNHLEVHRLAAAELTQIRASLGEAATTIEAKIEEIVVPAAIGARLNPVVDTDAIRRLERELRNTVSSLRSGMPNQETLDMLNRWPASRGTISVVLAQLRASVDSLPEPSATNQARDYLVAAQSALNALAEATAKQKSTASASERARHIFNIYVEATDGALEKIYEAVQETFGRLYRQVNSDDEGAFTARLSPDGSSLDLSVDFYGRGHFPPGAYHSEGHQDSMGICLYLALMKHIQGENFTFAVLDDVLMSVDAGHRRAVSRMLVKEFHGTQFVLTTHDPVWLKSMVSHGLIKAGKSVHFRTWNVDSGPADWEGLPVWDEIRRDIDADNIQNGASTLRHYLEYVSRELCHNLRARVEFHNDEQFPLGALLPQAIATMSQRYKIAKNASSSWGKNDEVTAITQSEEAFKMAAAATRVDEWHLNAAVHYNAWSNFQPEDFLPVVDAFEGLLTAFTCAECHALVFVTPGSGAEEALRCPCFTINMNLIAKTKS